MKLKSFILYIIVINLISHGCESNSNAKGGFAIHLGYGSVYGKFGIANEYQFVLKRKLRLTPSVSIGLLSYIKKINISYSIGCDIEIGNAQRFTIGTRFGTIYGEEIYSRDDMGYPIEIINVKPRHGPSLEIGYKGEAFFGLLWLVRMGYGLVIDGRNLNNIYPLPVFSTGLGWKF